jgi:predicted rRNA methylase YqxC with S4 and FtsJ domains
VLSLFKPQYEAPQEMVQRGVVAVDRFEDVLRSTLAELAGMGIPVRNVVRLPHDRERKNLEAMFYVSPQECGDPAAAR